MQFDVIINTPHGLYKKTRASIVNVVSTDGQRGILPNHMPIVVSLAVGKMTIEERKKLLRSSLSLLRTNHHLFIYARHWLGVFLVIRDR